VCQHNILRKSCASGAWACGRVPGTVQLLKLSNWNNSKMNSSSTAYTEQPPTVIWELISKSWDVCKLQFDGFPNFKSWHGWENCLKITWIPGINWALHIGLCRLFTLATICEEILLQRQQSIITAAYIPVLFTRKALCTYDSEVRFLVCVAAFNIHGTHSLKIFPCRPPIVIAAQTRTQKPETQKVDKCTRITLCIHRMALSSSMK